jgi:hypothetical protein
MRRLSHLLFTAMLAAPWIVAPSPSDGAVGPRLHESADQQGTLSLTIDADRVEQDVLQGKHQIPPALSQPTAVAQPIQIQHHDMDPVSAPAPGDENWWGGFSGTGIGGQVLCIGYYEGKLVIGGVFYSAGGTVGAQGVAEWEGDHWSALGNSSFAYSVNCLAEYHGELYIGGNIMTAAGAPSQGIVRWDGTTWRAVSTGANGVRALRVFRDTLYVGGNFSEAGNTQAYGIAAWDGTKFNAMGAGLAGAVMTIQVFHDSLFVGGNFVASGNVTGLNKVASWNGSNWLPVGGGVTAGDGGVFALAVCQDALAAGGEFSGVSGVPNTENLAAWNGSQWTSLGGGANDVVYGLAASGDSLIAGGWFTTIGSASAKGLASWNGSAWQEMAGGVKDYNNYRGIANALFADTSGVLVGGQFATTGDVEGMDLGLWDGRHWVNDIASSGAGLSYDVDALTMYDGSLVAGGPFSWASGKLANYIALWTGSEWDTLGSGMNEMVRALTVYQGDLIAGGEFSTAGGEPALAIARWDGAHWRSVGTGVSGTVRSLCVHGNDLYAGGTFFLAGSAIVNGVARFDGSRWHALGSGVQRWGGYGVAALSWYDDVLVVGGDFLSAGNAPNTRGIAEWDGEGWSSLASGLRGVRNWGEEYDPVVHGLCTFGDELAVTGDFTEAGGTYAHFLAAWNGSSWRGVGPGLGTIGFTVCADGSILYVGGFFPSHIAQWDGENWSVLGSGTNGSVRTITASGGYVYVGGQLNIAGSKSSFGVARWSSPTVSAMPVAQRPALWLSPNPFRSSTEIQFEVARSDRVTLAVYDIQGRVVNRLQDGVVEPGEHLARWDGRDNYGRAVAPGIYFVRIATSQGSAAKRVVLLP